MSDLAPCPVGHLPEPFDTVPCPKFDPDMTWSDDPDENNDVCRLCGHDRACHERGEATRTIPEAKHE